MTTNGGAEVPIVFDCEGRSLVGIVHNADPGAVVGVVIVVGGPQYRVGSHRQFVTIARRIAEAGYPVLRFDYRGMGDSEGEALGFTAVDRDIGCAIDCLTRSVSGLQRVVLLGLCDAASASLLYCAHTSDRRVAGLVLLNPWARTNKGQARSYLRYYYLQRPFQRSFWKKVLRGEYNVAESLRGLVGMLGKAFGGSAKKRQDAGGFIADMHKGLVEFEGPLLLLMSGRDLTAREFDALAQEEGWRSRLSRADVRVEWLHDADHTMSKVEHLNRACQEIADWLRCTFPRPPR